MTAVVPVVLIVSPLIRLTQYQAHKLKRLPGANPLLLSEEVAPEDGDMAEGGWTHIFTSPRLYSNHAGTWRKLLLSSDLLSSLITVVIDVAHCIVKW